MFYRRFFALGILPLVLTACSGGGGTTFYTPPPATVTNFGSCVPTSGQIQQSYPAVGAANVPDTISSIYIAANGTVQSSGYIALVPNGAIIGNGSYAYGSFTATQSVPAGAASNTFSNALYYKSSSNGLVDLPSGVLISVYFADSSQSCTPALLGTFTTQ